MSKLLDIIENMDPSATLCISYDSLRQSPPTPPSESVNRAYYNPPNIKLTPQYSTVSINAPPPAIYCDLARYNALQRAKQSFDVKGFIAARDAMNPFEKIGRSIFMNRAAIKLANTDAVYNVTEKVFSFDRKQSNDPFTFCDVAAGPGGFTQYIQYRFPKAIGYGMTLKGKLDWNTRALDMTRFTPFYGADGTGDLYFNWKDFIQVVLSQQLPGVDLVMGDGGFDMEEGSDKALLQHQEFLSSRLLLTQAIIGIGCSKQGGNFVLKVFDTVTEFSAEILFILSCCFESIRVFKPISSRPANSERYVICLNRNADVLPCYRLLADATPSYENNVFLDRLFEEPLPSAFISWLTDINNSSIESQLIAAENIISYIQGGSPVIPTYDIEKFLTIWNLPDTPPHPRQTAILIR